MAAPHGAPPPSRSTPAVTDSAPRSALRSTQIFGGAPPEGSAQALGAVPSVAPVIPPVGRTQAYGVAAGQVPAPGRHGTQVFGTAPAQVSGASVGTTQTYGVGTSSQTASSDVPSSRAAMPRPGAPVGTTQTSGVSAGPSQGVPARSAGAQGNTTQTYGAFVPPPGGGSAPDTTTQSFVPAPVSPRSVGGGTGSEAPAIVPHALGAVPGSDALGPMGRSQTFSPIQASASEAPAGTERVLGVSPPMEQAGLVSRRADAEPAPETRPEAASGVRATSPFGLPALFGSEGGGIQLPPESDPPAGASAPLSDFGDGAGAPEGATSRRAPVELPPELLSSSRVSAASTGEYSGSGAWRVRPRLGLLILVGLILAAGLASVVLKPRGVAIPADVVDATDRAAVLLRRDDATSRGQAIQRLHAVTASHPHYLEAHAELAVALSLNLSDLQADIERLRLQSEAVAREREAALKLSQRAEREARRAALQQELEAIAREMAPQRASMELLRKELDAQITLLGKAPKEESASAAAARLKARALYASVLAVPDALALAERLRNTEGAPHLWSTVARAEYALSASSPPDTLVAVAKDLEALRQADSSLLRAYLLGARVALRLKDTAAARSLLDDALALNPGHAVASRLIAQIDADAAP